MTRNVSGTDTTWRQLAIVALYASGVGPASIGVRLGVNIRTVVTTLRVYDFPCEGYPATHHQSQRSWSADGGKNIKMQRQRRRLKEKANG